MRLITSVETKGLQEMGLLDIIWGSIITTVAKREISKDKAFQETMKQHHDKIKQIEKNIEELVREARKDDER